jgi:ribosome-binding factor A
MTRRTQRVNELIREELSSLIQRDLKDPRLGQGLTTVTEVTVSPDLRNATVYISHMGGGGEAERNDVLKALASASHFLHNELRRRLDLRLVPELTFKFDISIERGARLAALINQVAAAPGDDEGG